MADTIVWGEGCEDCGGTGAQYQHKPTCTSDFCVGNGDCYDCGGTWVPCSGCPNVQAIYEAEQAANASGLDCVDCGGFVPLDSLNRRCLTCRQQYERELAAIKAGELPF